MKQHLIFLFIIILSSCNSLSKIEKNNIIYSVPQKAEKIIANEISLLKKVKENVFIELDFTENNYIITLIPTATLDREVQNIKLNKTGRVLNIDWKYYFVTFNADNSLGGYLESIENKNENIISKKTIISDYAKKLIFDKEWNLK